MKLGIMQPYFFPYIGYYQYAAACDKFVFYDDVAFIMRGWINRNYIRLNHQKHLITVPLSKASPNRLIKDIETAKDPDWKRKILHNIRNAYAQASEFKNVYPLIERVFDLDTARIAELAKESVRSVFNYLDIKISFGGSSEVYRNNDLKREKRVIDIVKKENYPEIVVPWGGKELYEKELFKNNGIDLCYIKPVIEAYRQNGREFIPSLSMIDVLMFNGKDACRAMIRKHELA